MGHEMELIEVATGGWRYACKKCATSYKADKKAASGWLSPIRSRKDLAFEATMMLAAEPENHPLTLEEVIEIGKDADSIVYIEDRKLELCGWNQPCTIIFDGANGEPRREIHFYEPGNDLPEFWPEAEYGKSWRCWPRKPTPEQMAAAKWEE